MVDFLTIVVSIVALIPLYIDLILRLKDRKKIEFIVERFYEPTTKPIDSDWGIKILYPNKPIEKCSVLYNGDLIPWSGNQPYYEKRFVVNSGGNVRVPKAKQKEDAEIKIQNNNKTLKKVKFKDLLISQ